MKVEVIEENLTLRKELKELSKEMENLRNEISELKVNINLDIIRIKGEIEVIKIWLNFPCEGIFHFCTGVASILMKRHWR